MQGSWVIKPDQIIAPNDLILHGIEKNTLYPVFRELRPGESRPPTTEKTNITRNMEGNWVIKSDYIIPPPGMSSSWGLNKTTLEPIFTPVVKPTVKPEYRVNPFVNTDNLSSNKDVLRRTGFNFQSGGNNQDLYYEKYLKYKNKYNQLKKSI